MTNGVIYNIYTKLVILTKYVPMLVEVVVSFTKILLHPMISQAICYGETK